MSILKNISKTAAILAAMIFLGSCEDDFNTVGNDIIGENDFNSEPYVSDVIAYNKKIDAVQTSDLPLYFLGGLTDPLYGLSEANILAQASLSVPNPDFGNDPVLDSVVMVLPYYSRVTEQTNEGATYELDSVYGGGGMKVSVYESNYFLRDLDPESNFEETQRYYSNQTADFESNLGVLFTEKNIVPENQEVVLFQNEGEEQDTLRLAPRMRVHLPVDFFNQNIIEKEGSEELLSNANFKNYFRGLYLKAEGIGSGTLAAINFAGQEAKVVLYYKVTVPDPTSETGETMESPREYTLNLQGNIVNAYNNNFLVNLANQDTENGEQNLYLKGGEGSMAILELFNGPDSNNDGISDELDMLREENWLINEANLIFSVNNTLLPEETREPQRIFIYDLKENTTLLDYQTDFSANDSNPNTSRIVHLGPLSTDGNGNEYYKIRVTGLINNIINLDSTANKLGITVSSNVNLPTFSKLKDTEDEQPSAVPKTSVISPRGTVLYGNNVADEDKRLKLNIYYTKPE